VERLSNRGRKRGWRDETLRRADAAGVAESVAWIVIE
jgi:hypothetical protein